ncbi:T9SS type A sorting domain-containing protein [bacterium]|nr:T9SS type A sorting domain-containing protein [bacterium]MBU1984388.1 T9SS type A sorting domain-containing protein [bacterium]
MRTAFVVIFITMFFGIAIAQPQPPDTLWTYTYSSSINDAAYSIARVPNGGFMIGGEGRAPDSTDGGLLLRLNDDGQELWLHRIAPFYRIGAVFPATDGRYILTGESNVPSCVALAKVDSNGEVQWSTCISDPYSEPGMSIAEGIDGRIAVLIVGDAIPSSYLRLACLTADGDSLWVQSFGSPGIYKGGAVVSTSEGGFLTVASENYQAYIAKTDGEGIVQWNNSFGAGNLAERLNAVNETADGDFIVAGTQTRDAFTFNPYAARTDSSGDTLWTRAYPQLGPAFFYSVVEVDDGSILFGGSTGGSFLLAACDPNGYLIWSGLYGTPQQEDCRGMCLDSEGGAVMAGYKATIAEHSEDIWVIRTASVLRTEHEHYTPVSRSILLSSFPNPFNAVTRVEFEIPRTSRVTIRAHDILGREVGTITDDMFAIGQHSVSWQCADCASGVYFIAMTGDGFHLVRKAILLR